MKIKKYFYLLCCFAFAFLMFGFTFKQPKNYIDNTKFSHVVVNDGSSVTETFALNLQQFENIDSVVQNLILARFQTVLSNIKVEYNNKVDQETDKDKKESLLNTIVGVAKAEQGLIYVKITFANLQSWQYFSNNQQTSVKNKVFTNDTVANGRIGSQTTVLGQSQFTADALKQVATDILQQTTTSWQGDGQNMYSYSYVTKYKRRHSTSTDILQIDDLYYHQWLLDENPDISFWITTPNYIWWYVCGIGGGVLVGTTIFLIAHFKNKPKKQNDKISSETI